MAASFFKQRKPKRFNYKPRYSKDREEESASKKDEFISKWERAKESNKHKPSTTISLRFMILFLVLLLICMYLLDEKFA